MKGAPSRSFSAFAVPRRRPRPPRSRAAWAWARPKCRNCSPSGRSCAGSANWSADSTTYTGNWYTPTPTPTPTLRQLTISPTPTHPVHAHPHPRPRRHSLTPHRPSLTHALTHSRTHARTHSLIHSRTHSLIHLRTHSLIHLRTHSFPLPRTVAVAQFCIANPNPNPHPNPNSRSILHRDLKPDNIFFAKATKKTIKLGDLGVARQLEDTHDMATTVMGTPYYMSPEVMAGKPYTFASDVWSLGCVLYEMAARRIAFNAAGLPQVMKMEWWSTYVSYTCIETQRETKKERKKERKRLRVQR